MQVYGSFEVSGAPDPTSGLLPVTHSQTGQKGLIKIIPGRGNSQSILEAFEVQQKMSVSGSTGWLAILEFGATDSECYAVYEIPPYSISSLIHRGVQPSSRILYQTCQAILKGLIDLHNQHERQHGNLKPSNVFFEANGGPDYNAARLSDLLPSDQFELKPFESDQRALGLLLYQFVRAKESLPPNLRSLPDDEPFWPQKPEKKDADWRNFINGLIAGDFDGQSLHSILRQTKQFGPKDNKIGRAAGIILAACIPIVGIVYFLNSGTSNPNEEGGNDPNHADNIPSEVKNSPTQVVETIEPRQTEPVRPSLDKELLADYQQYAGTWFAPNLQEPLRSELPPNAQLLQILDILPPHVSPEDPAVSSEELKQILDKLNSFKIKLDSWSTQPAVDMTAFDPRMPYFEDLKRAVSAGGQKLDYSDPQSLSSDISNTYYRNNAIKRSIEDVRSSWEKLTATIESTDDTAWERNELQLQEMVLHDYRFALDQEFPPSPAQHPLEAHELAETLSNKALELQKQLESGAYSWPQHWDQLHATVRSNELVNLRTILNNNKPETYDNWKRDTESHEPVSLEDLFGEKWPPRFGAFSNKFNAFRLDLQKSPQYSPTLSTNSFRQELTHLQGRQSEIEKEAKLRGTPGDQIQTQGDKLLEEFTNLMTSLNNERSNLETYVAQRNENAAVQKAREAFANADYEEVETLASNWKENSELYSLRTNANREREQLEQLRQKVEKSEYEDVLNNTNAPRQKNRFKELFNQASSEHEVLTNATHKFASGDYDFIASLRTNTYAEKPKFKELLENSQNEHSKLNRAEDYQEQGDARTAKSYIQGLESTVKEKQPFQDILAWADQEIANKDYEQAQDYFNESKYEEAVTLSNNHQGEKRFDDLISNIKGDQTRLAELEQLLNAGNYENILTAQLPDRPAFHSLKERARAASNQESALAAKQSTNSITNEKSNTRLQTLDKHLKFYLIKFGLEEEDPNFTMPGTDEVVRPVPKTDLGGLDKIEEHLVVLRNQYEKGGWLNSDRESKLNELIETIRNW